MTLTLGTLLLLELLIIQITGYGGKDSVYLFKVCYDAALRPLEYFPFALRR